VQGAVHGKCPLDPGRWPNASAIGEPRAGLYIAGRPAWVRLEIAVADITDDRARSACLASINIALGFRRPHSASPATKRHADNRSGSCWRPARSVKVEENAALCRAFPQPGPALFPAVWVHSNGPPPSSLGDLAESVRRLARRTARRRCRGTPGNQHRRSSRRPELRVGDSHRPYLQGVEQFSIRGNRNGRTELVQDRGVATCSPPTGKNGQVPGPRIASGIAGELQRQVRVMTPSRCLPIRRTAASGSYRPGGGIFLARPAPRGHQLSRLWRSPTLSDSTIVLHRACSAPRWWPEQRVAANVPPSEASAPGSIGKKHPLVRRRYSFSAPCG